jgi:glycine/D-amino acid oxidase-like deaminating enzyme|tara:strand:- start:5113 stop:6504 length:1392 start_codon:yes stop_codon:yes gene_type:complete
MSSLQNAREAPLWMDSFDCESPKRKPIEGPVSVDVAIIGGGYSGLWTAYYLLKNDPSLRVIVIEKEYCGYGASGRNGGWCEGALAGGTEKYAKRSTLDDALRLERTMFTTVDEIQDVLASESIDCGFHKGGFISLARNLPQAKRQRASVELARKRGMGEEIIRLLEADEARAHVNATDLQSGIFFAPSAVVDPGKMVRGLASAVEAKGGTIVEGTTALSISPGKVVCSHGEVSANVIVQATEAYTRDIRGKKLDLLPVYSQMIATEPLDDSQMSNIGLEDRPTFNDGRYIVIYGQRTSDNRIAFGGQGKPPYLFGSKIDSSIESNFQSHQVVWENLVRLLPQLREVAITHRWGGTLAIPRNWLPSVRFDKLSGVGFLGGYVGEGVAAANLAGRTMADLILERQTDLVSLPWVGVRSRKWEPEPLRWLGVRASRRFMGAADVSETKTQKTARLAMKAAHFLRGD